jgi:hypothetical protein
MEIPPLSKNWKKSMLVFLKKSFPSPFRHSRETGNPVFSMPFLYPGFPPVQEG